MFYFTIDQIRCFQAVIDEGSFTKAGERLNRAKSAVRYSVNALEEQLGFPILDRNAYRPFATPQGEAFLRRSRKLVEEHEKLKESAAQIASGIESRLTLSVSGLYDAGFLYSVIKQAMRAFPATEIILERELLSGERMLFRNQVDLAVADKLTNNLDLEIKSLGSIRMIPVIAASHPFLNLPGERRTRRQFMRYPQIIQRSTISDDDLTFGVHEDAIQWRVADTPSKREIILNGLGWGKLPQHMVVDDLEQGRLKVVEEFDETVEVQIFLARRKNSFIGKVSQFIWESFA